MNKKNLNNITVYYNEKKYHYNSLYDFFIIIGRYSLENFLKNYNKKKSKILPYNNNEIFFNDNYILDDVDIIIPEWKIIEEIKNSKIIAYWDNIYIKEHRNSVFCKRKNYVFRKGSVPCIGKKRGQMKHLFRHPKTFQEIKNSYSIENFNSKYENEFFIKIRPNRNSSNLPDLYDDLIRKNYKEKNWKRYRKTQWK